MHVKKRVRTARNDYKLIILEGEHQTDSIGKTLESPIVVRASRNGALLDKYYVRFELQGCEGFSAELYEDRPGVPIYYYWKLNSNPGTQSLKITLLDENKIERNSSIVTAEALAEKSGWFTAGCAPDGSPIDLEYVEGGRIMGAFYRNPGLFYSDDSGVSWQPLSTFNQNSQISDITSISSSEILITTIDHGLAYSSDGGKSWELRNPTTAKGSFHNFFYTRDKRFFLRSKDSLYYSIDNGKNWQRSVYGKNSMVNTNFINSSSNGNLYALNDGKLLLSEDNGNNWTRKSFDENYKISSLFIDEDNSIYLGAYNHTTQKIEILVSKDYLKTTRPVYAVKPAVGGTVYIGDVRKQFGFYSFYVNNYGIVTTKDFVSYDITSPENTRDGLWYVFSGQNSLVTYSQKRNGISYFKP